MRGPISEEDLEFGLQQPELPDNKGPEDSGIVYKLLKQAPDRMKKIILECLNLILEGSAVPSKSCPVGRVCFLFKKGGPMDIACYLPVYVLDKVYKVLSDCRAS